MSSRHVNRREFGHLADWEGDASMEITAGAASIVRAGREWSPIGGEKHVDTARKVLDHVDASEVTRSPLFSGHGGHHRPDMRVGDTFDIPLMATSADQKVAEGFGSENVYRFASHRSVPVNRQERVVSGRYKITGQEGNYTDLEYVDRLPRREV